MNMIIISIGAVKTVSEALVLGSVKLNEGLMYIIEIRIQRTYTLPLVQLGHVSAVTKNVTTTQGLRLELKLMTRN